jgi:uncharacterized membrane protein YdjX (TVP38/TMEM64 family)
LAGIAAYVVLASFGAPQVVLITALVAVFGPWLGLLYSWTGKVLASSLGFWVGRRFGAQVVERHSGPRVAELMRYLAKHGFWASALIRLVPTVPSVLVNIAAGATPIRFRDFVAGTALGSVPKMALLAFGSAAAITAVQKGSVWAWCALALVIALWALLAFAGRGWLARAGKAPANSEPAPSRSEEADATRPRGKTMADQMHDGG